MAWVGLAVSAYLEYAFAARVGSDGLVAVIEWPLKERNVRSERPERGIEHRLPPVDGVARGTVEEGGGRTTCEFGIGRVSSHQAVPNGRSSCRKGRHRGVQCLHGWIPSVVANRGERKEHPLRLEVKVLGVELCCRPVDAPQDRRIESIRRRHRYRLECTHATVATHEDLVEGTSVGRCCAEKIQCASVDSTRREEGGGDWEAPVCAVQNLNRRRPSIRVIALEVGGHAPSVEGVDNSLSRLQSTAVSHRFPGMEADNVVAVRVEGNVAENVELVEAVVVHVEVRRGVLRIGAHTTRVWKALLGHRPRSNVILETKREGVLGGIVRFERHRCTHWCRRVHRARVDRTGGVRLMDNGVLRGDHLDLVPNGAERGVDHESSNA